MIVAGMGRSDTPLVSCLMVTQAKRWADGPPPGFVAFCFQTYEPRELVLVTKDPCAEMERAADALEGHVRFVDVSEEAPRATLGELRQIAVDCAAGALVSTWDDDDVSAPARLAEQVRVLKGMPLMDACVLARMRVEDVGRDRRFVSPYFAWEQAMLARRESMTPYPAIPIGEDFQVVSSFGRLVALDRPDLYTYRIHGDNVIGGDRAEEWYAARTGGAW